MASNALNTGAPTRATSDDPNLSRRGALGLAISALAYGAGAAAVAGAGFAISEAKGAPASHAPTAFSIAQARYEAATARFNGLPQTLETDDPAAFEREEEAYLKSYRAFIVQPANNERELLAALEEALEPGGHPGEDQCLKLLADARRILGREGC